MNILKFHKQLIENYKSYIKSFLNIKDQRISEFVNNKLDENNLWPEPLIQFNPRFESSIDINRLVAKNNIHPELAKIFRKFTLFKHQEEAILLGASGKEFIVTSGTGSGKSLTFLATIFNHVLNQKASETENKIQAIIVYPMNALINSQFNEINGLKNEYERHFGEDFPITFAQYTGQEDEQQKEKVKTNPPHILLTNYMMLELLMTRSGRDADIKTNFLKNAHFLVFDELHTYRGRQGSDVSLLIRRIRSAASNPISCIGTSATMVSGDDTTILEEKKKVAEVASIILGSTIKHTEVVNEYLVRSLNLEYKPDCDALVKEINTPINIDAEADVFRNHETANWLENEIALEEKEGTLIRRKPLSISDIIDKLVIECSLDRRIIEIHILQLLEWANRLNGILGRSEKLLPYRIHQFIAQTSSVYSTLGDQDSREYQMETGRYADDENTMLYPMMFSRTSGHEFTCVTLRSEDSKILPREFSDYSDDEDISLSDGYIFIQHNNDSAPIWDEENDLELLPQTWFNPPRVDGTRTVKKRYIDSLPRKIWFNKTGEYSFAQELNFSGWYIAAPLRFDPTSGQVFSARTGEWTKLMKLGGEGRSTATTVMSFETISLLQKHGERAAQQKLLSFTDNRQDASLQAGHFNDFIKVGQLRASVYRALTKHEKLDYSTIHDEVFKALNIKQEDYAVKPATFPGPKKENEDTLKDLIMYRLLYDLRRSWRVVMPNLEQCALLEIDYRFLRKSSENNSLWENNELLKVMHPEDRYIFLYQILDFFRKSYALKFSMLESGAIESNTKRINEKLLPPWTLDEQEKIEIPSSIRIERLHGSINNYTTSGGNLSSLGRYIKEYAKDYEIEIEGTEGYNEFAYQLFDFLVEAGWLFKKQLRNVHQEYVNVYQLNVEYILWKKGNGETITPDRVQTRSYKEITERPNEYFKHFYKTNFNEIKEIVGKEHTGQIDSEARKERERKFRDGEIGALYCSPTMELGVDISDLSIVHMRNVPPSPANYAQRSGRAGRSGQASLVLVYCSNMSAHDRHFFKNSTQMVSGTVTAPRIDLINEELLQSHLNAVILSYRPLIVLEESIGQVIDTEKLDELPIKPEVKEVLKISPNLKKEIINTYRKVIEDTYFRDEFLLRRPVWFTDSWINKQVDSFYKNFDKSFNRWRKLYLDAQKQILEATHIIDNRIYAEDHKKKNEAYYNLYQAVRQRDLLVNDPTDGKKFSNDQSEFYPYRYLASEGFLPGYNFTRLPVRSFMETKNAGGKYISRPRFLALEEFGPQNLVYHDGAKYRINRMIVSDAHERITQGKVCPDTGYFLYDTQFNYEVDPITKDPLQLDSSMHVHTNLLEMSESKAYEMQRITSQEEERRRRGYVTQTYFASDDDFKSSITGHVGIEEEKLLNIHYFPACRIFKLNTKWRSSEEDGFAINLKTGYWQSKKEQTENADNDDLRVIKLFTTDVANALYIQPVKSLALEGGRDGVITLLFAFKRAIENYFQIESNEIGATVMGKEDSPNIFLYEAAEGSLGVLSQILDSPEIFRAIMDEAYRICFYVNDEEEVGRVLPATYDDLLSYYNQYFHESIDRNLIRHALRNLKETSVTIVPNAAFDNYDQQYHFLQKARDHNSSTEDQFLKYLYKHGLKLPDEAQPNVDKMFVRPDFFYKPDIYIFCDGTPHDDPKVKKDDEQKRTALDNAGYQVLTWYYRDSLDEFVASRPDIFKKVKEK